MPRGTDEPAESPAAAPAPPPVPWREAWPFWLKLGFISFGGPAGQIAIMHAELVERRRWVSEGRFLHALNYCMLLPGPEAQQLATYLGWLMHRRLGGIVAGALFVLPSLGVLIALSWAYLRHGQVGWVAGIFYGLKPAVVALVLHAAWRLGRRALATRAGAALALASFIALALFRLPFPALVIAAGLLGWWAERRWPGSFAASAHTARRSSGAPAARALIDDDTPPPAHARDTRPLRVLAAGVALWALAMAGLVATLGLDATLTRMAGFFTQAALLTFGGAYAVLPYVVQGAVEQYQWLTSAQMIDGLALGETTPGPLIMVVAFVGFVAGWTQQLAGAGEPLLGGMLAAGLVTFFTFLPSFVFILAGAPVVEATRGQPRVAGPLAAIGAAVVGAILQLALFFAAHVLWREGALDPTALAIAAVAALLLFSGRLGVVPVLLLAAGAGVVVGAPG
jgi:chromate transporter